MLILCSINVVLINLLLIGAHARASSRIAGGEIVTIDRYPFATSLLTNVGAGTYAHSCGGSILTANAILSAASCFYTDGEADPATWWRARVGSTYSNRGGLTYLIRTITANPNFSPTTRDNDIAVLRSTLNIHLTPGLVEPASLSGGAYSFSDNQQVWAIGWGAFSSGDPETISPELRHVQIWTIPQQTCANRYNELGFTVTSNMVCAGWLDVGVTGQCQGDSGSPLLVDGYIVGVHSWVQGCAQGWYPSINTRLNLYNNWVIAAATA
ncbi:trypsin CFT-1-like isoform X2 [Cydia pomonella]|uniref:trypsin CFT-1-like isoform X2 n=1 Tax=Cydia pomonella TaxID=82600 RepID=UPI002ADDAA1B|nr:trypsin CFT-1-like isoform X2 [Cydia pomonella]